MSSRSLLSFPLSLSLSVFLFPPFSLSFYLSVLRDSKKWPARMIYVEPTRRRHIQNGEEGGRRIFFVLAEHFIGSVRVPRHDCFEILEVRIYNTLARAGGLSLSDTQTGERRPFRKIFYANWLRGQGLQTSRRAARYGERSGKG